MKYFILRKDERFNDGPYIANISINHKFVCKEQFYKIPKRQSATIKVKETTIFPDFMDRPVLIVSELFWSVVKMYQDTALKRDLVLIEPESQMIKQYYIILLENVPILKDSNQNITDISLEQKGRPLEDRNIFEIELEGKREIVVNLDFAESILRRKCFGIQLEEVTLCEI